jgi:hypothetical protein
LVVDQLDGTEGELMYLIGKGSDVMGPGTSMVQRIDWTQDQETQLRNAQIGRGSGLGCVGLGCLGLGSVPEFAADCRQMSRYKGMGCGARDQMPYCGLGLFDSGMDFTTWGWPEWALVGVGVYAGLSLLGDTKRGVQRASRVGRAVRKAA